MKKSFYVERQLAQQLKEDSQALAIKQVSVNGLKDKLAEIKREIIEDRLGGHTFSFVSENWVFLGVTEDHYTDTMYFRIEFGRMPEDVVSQRAKLTDEEKALLDTYREKIEELKHNFWRCDAKKAKVVAEKLRQLKHHYNLTGCWSWEFSFEDALYENFYNQTGMYYEDDNGVVKLIEEYIIPKKKHKT